MAVDFSIAQAVARRQRHGPVAPCFLPEDPVKAVRTLKARREFMQSVNLLEAQPTDGPLEDCQRRLTALGEAIRGRV